MAAVLPASVLALAQAPASAAPLPAAYAASAHSDIVDLDVDLLSLDLAGVQVGHSLSSVASTITGGSSTATSANLGGSLDGTGLTLDEQTATAPPSQDPPAETLVGVPLGAAITVGAIEGDTQAAWAGPNACLTADGAGNRILSDSRTTLAGLTLASLPGLGVLADVKASETRTRTFLDDKETGGSDVVSRASTTVGDISLLGGTVTVDVTDPVVLQARSDGSTGRAGYVNPPTVVATVAGEEVAIPTDGQPQTIELPLLLDPLVNLTITAYPVQDQSSGATGAADADALLDVDIEVVDTELLDAADVSLGIGPMAVEATAPTGGVECGGVDDDTPAAPVIVTPAEGSVTDDATPEFSGTAEPGSTVVVRDPEGDEVCTDVADSSGAWSCTPTTPLPDGTNPYTATATDEAGNTSLPDTVTFTIDSSVGDTTPPAAPVITSPAEGASVQDTTPLISGTGETGATVTVTEGSTVLCTAVVGGNGTWSCSPTVALPLGPHTVSATQADAAGNASPADSVTFTVVAGSGDTDGDGLLDGQEGTIGTDPNNPDTDGDGLTDGAEVNVHLTDPLDPDTDGDRITDGREVSGVRIHERFEVCGKKVRTAIVVRTNPLEKDTDQDGLNDGTEVRGYKIKQKVKTRKKTFVIGKTRSNPRKRDTDRDGLTDKVEVTGKANKRWGKDRTDPTKCDTDSGGVRDGAEVRARSNPADWRSGPRDPRVRSGRPSGRSDSFGIG